jgi:energy-coupling factor transporter ATP-binding protein EcfA2
VSLRNRALLVDGVDAKRYVDRPLLERALEDAVADGRNTLLIGPPGSGKTTLLRKLAADLKPAPRSVAWVNPALADNGVELLELIAHCVEEAADIRHETPRRPTVPADATGPLRLLGALERVPSRPPTVVLIDGTLQPEAAYDVFGRLRDQLWALPHTWVLATTSERSGAVRAAPADAFWSTIIEVGPMTAAQIDDLLRRGLSASERAQVDAHEMRPVQDTPRRVIRFAQDVLDGTLSGVDLPEARRHERAAALSRGASMALAELEGLGRPAAASDPELLARLGWTRPYASRVLAGLESAGVLRSFPAAAVGQGRPPKLYEPNPSV